MINNRQNGRRRGRGGQRVGGGGNSGQQGNGSRIDNRARGNASQLHEKYKSLARDAQLQGDRVNTEYYLQFADHYFRVLNENRQRFEEQNPNQSAGQRRQPDGFDDDFDGDGEEYGAEGEPVRADQYQPQQQERPRYDDRPRFEERPRQNERPRYEERPRQGQGQDDRPDRPRLDDQRPRDDQRAPRDERRPRHEGGQPNGNGHARDGAPASAPEPREEVIAAPRPVDDAATGAADPNAPAPRRRGRPPRARTEEAAAPAAFEADRLPPSLSVAASAEPDAAEPEKPRRRRRAPGPLEAPPAS